MGWAANRPSEEKTVADVGRTWYTRYNIHGSYFPIHKITEPAALTRSIAVHTQCTLPAARPHISLSALSRVNDRALLGSSGARVRVTATGVGTTE